MIKVTRGYMYNPEESTVLINEIYYEEATGNKLSSKMDTINYIELSENIRVQIEEVDSKSYQEEIIMNEEDGKVYIDEINKYGKPKKLYAIYR
ncbi:hypothetical protein DX932_30345 [Bacillus cereus]|uniref:Uncharacterized protein n=1 Tax=Bacillus cereus TaxID=1396 RepID=A0A9W7PZG0_BACCE|nr:hypothetical protein [Bacillus cereus]KAA6449239.1 hypothetical protein DX932_30345 [Bacillus cereus]